MKKTPVQTVGEKFVPFVEDRSKLSPKALALIESMQGTDPIGYFTTLIFTWISIGAAVLLAVYVNNIFLTIVTVIFVATRQKAIALLVHEQTHQHGILAPWGDYVVNLLCAYPLVISIEGYRRIHLSHHTYFFDSEKDPDYRRKQGLQWDFPQEGGHFLKTIVKDLSGRNAIALYKSKQSIVLGAEFDRTNPTINWILRLIFYVVTLTGITFFHLWPAFLIFWVLPLITVFQVIVRWGAICEHRYNLINPTISEATPMILPRWWEELLLPDLNFYYHVYHHWWPRIPWTRLPKVAAIFKQEGLLHEERIFQGYRSYLQFLLRKN